MPGPNLTTVATAAAQLLGVMDSGESLSTQQLNDTLAIVNNFLDNWSSEESMIAPIVRQTFVTVAATQTYTIGTGQAINVTRPVAVAAAAGSSATIPGYGIEVVNALKWAGIEDRQAQSWRIRALFYDRGNPTGTIYLSPIPIGILTVELWIWAALPQFADLTTGITTFPPAYLRAIEHQCAVEIAPMFSMSPSADLMANRDDAIARIKNLNAQLLGSAVPALQTSAAAGAPIAPIQQ